jgi:hypothetical protein
MKFRRVCVLEEKRDKGSVLCPVVADQQVGQFPELVREGGVV